MRVNQKGANVPGQSSQQISYKGWSTQYKGEPMSEEEWELRTNGGRYFPMT